MFAMTNVTMRANAITHNGRFHANDVLATVILEKVLGSIVVCRTAVLPKGLDPKVMIYDIGFTKYAYHQRDGKQVRENGMPYATCGLIWKKYGPQLVADTENPEWVWKYVDEDLIQIVDREDEGNLFKTDYPPRTTSFSQLISDFNPKWDSLESEDEAFTKAVAFAEIVFNNVLAKAVSKAKSKVIVEEAIEKSEDHVMILEQYAPWKEFLKTSANKKAEEVQLVIYPSKGEKRWNCVSISEDFMGGAFNRQTETLEHAKNLAKIRVTK